MTEKKKEWAPRENPPYALPLLLKNDHSLILELLLVYITVHCTCIRVGYQSCRDLSLNIIIAESHYNGHLMRSYSMDQSNSEFEICNLE